MRRAFMPSWRAQKKRRTMEGINLHPWLIDGRGREIGGLARHWPNPPSSAGKVSQLDVYPGYGGVRPSYGGKTGQPRAKGNYMRLRKYLVIPENPIQVEVPITTKDTTTANHAFAEIIEACNLDVAKASLHVVANEPSSLFSLEKPYTLKLSSSEVSHLPSPILPKTRLGPTRHAPTKWAKVSSPKHTSFKHVDVDLGYEINLDIPAALTSAPSEQGETTPAHSTPPLVSALQQGPTSTGILFHSL
ncbi:hypothetical protein ACFE04_027455 [Oxalis oulophora]